MRLLANMLFALFMRSDGGAAELLGITYFLGTVRMCAIQSYISHE